MDRENFLYKHIDFPYNKQEIDLFLENNPSEPGRFKILENKKVLEELPSIASWFRKNNLEVTKVAYISIDQKVTQVIHLDSGPETLALNIPVFNCDKNFTNFYDINVNEVKRGLTIGTELPYYYFESSSINSLLGQYYMTGPVILNVKKPHSVVNISNDSRICLSFRFKEDPWHLVS